MSAQSTDHASSARAVHGISAAVHLVVAIAIGALALAQASILMPVALSVPVSGSVGVFASVDLAAASAIVVLIGAAAHAASALRPSREPDSVRPRLLQLVAFAQTSAITVFLVAQLNGVAEAGTLVAIYALGGGAAGLLWLQAREVGEHRRSRWPFSFGAGLAVVPWGIVALYQIVGLIAGSPPAPLVRVLTVVVLVLVALAWWAERRWQLGLDDERRTAVTHAALSAANGIALLVLAAGLSRPSALF